MKKLQSKRVAIGVLIVVVLGFYWIDTVRIQRNVRRAVSNSLSQSLKSEIALQPTVLSNGVPAKDQGDLYIVVHDVKANNSYRVLNVNDYWVQRQIETATRISFDQDTTTPVAKFTSFSIQWVPGINSAVAWTFVQYVTPFGIVRSMRVDAVNAPLKHRPAS